MSVAFGEPSTSLSPFAPARRALSLGLLLGVLLIAFESLAVATALPQVARDLNGLKLYGWPLSAFFMGFMVGTVGLGALADRDGPARPVLLALLLFGAGLSVAGLAPSMTVLIAGRVLQGLGGGGVIAAAYLVINTAYPDAMRARMLALISSAWVLPALVGPALASYVTGRWSWRGVFVGLLPLVLLAAGLLLPQLGKLRGAGTPLNRARLGAVVWAACGVTLGLSGITELGQGKVWGAGLMLGGAALALPALGRLFPARAWALGTPLSAGYAVRFLLAFAFFGSESLLPLGLSELRGLSLLGAGLFLTSGALIWSATSFAQSRFDERTAGQQRAGGGAARHGGDCPGTAWPAGDARYRVADRLWGGGLGAGRAGHGPGVSGAHPGGDAPRARGSGGPGQRHLAALGHAGQRPGRGAGRSAGGRLRHGGRGAGAIWRHGVAGAPHGLGGGAAARQRGLRPNLGVWTDTPRR